jgi:hypothetical protein
MDFELTVGGFGEAKAAGRAPPGAGDCNTEWVSGVVPGIWGYSILTKLFNDVACNCGILEVAECLNPLHHRSSAFSPHIYIVVGGRCMSRSCLEQ